MTIRPATLDDLEAMRRVCLLTGDSGQDATGRWSSDGLLPDVYLEPYVRYPAALGWVVQEGGHVAGYVVGVADTDDFANWWRQSWVPEFVGRHGDTSSRDDEMWLFDGGTRPELMLRLVAATGYPAHLHIDLLPEAQGRGLGRELLRTFGEELVVRDVAGVHLGVGEDNVGAAAFYRRLGFDEPAPGVMSSPSARLARS
ncbi:GNAT family N-acetyltransferase [Knoellia sp. CPCC 206453]|uniref:GNAT family N-acetyltransferase n=1 Tax=Knoellia pratensis TaxID=3404796 RepID=UPI003607E3C8